MQQVSQTSAFADEVLAIVGAYLVKQYLVKQWWKHGCNPKAAASKSPTCTMTATTRFQSGWPGRGTLSVTWYLQQQRASSNSAV
jgi:hypothetical protein